jgi:hypothetical protein
MSASASREEQLAETARTEPTTAHKPSHSAWVPLDYAEKPPSTTHPAAAPSPKDFLRRSTDHSSNRSKARSSRGGDGEWSINGKSHKSLGSFPDSAQGTRRSKQKQAEPSFQDRLAASAVSGTLGFLKMAGGLTLTTAGTLAAPPIHVARTHLLPLLWQATVDTIASATPDRVKDWFRILSISIRHFFSVMSSTERGIAFRGRLVVLLSDVVDVLSSDATRQVILDGTASLVKFAELLNTPEYHAWTEQLAVWVCRIIQAASEGTNQELVHDLAAVMQSGSQLLADPHTTLALAEVTAYLCHALEMQNNHGLFVELGDSPESAQYRQGRASKRRERNQYQTRTHADRVTVKDSAATVEQVILSSLGASEVLEEGGMVDDTASSATTSVACGNSEGGDTRHDRTFRESDQDSSNLQKMEDSIDEKLSQEKPSEDWHVRARSVVDVDYLREQIHARADALRGTSRMPLENMSVHISLTPKGDDDDDMEDLAETREQKNVGSSRKKIQLADPGNVGDPPLVMDPMLPRIANELPREGEAPIEHFHRVLNEIFDNKRKEAFQTINGSNLGIMGRATVHPKLHRTKNDEVPNLKEQIVAAGAERWKRKIQTKVPKPAEWHVSVIIFSLGALVAAIWLGLGCYGLYCVLFPNHRLGGSAKHSVPSEIVVRIIREVVHVDAAGNFVGHGSDSNYIQHDQIDRMANCVANAFN